MHLAAFADHLYGKGLADRTVSEYVKWVRRAALFAHDRCNTLPDLPAHMIRIWADTTVPTSWASRKQAAAALRHYYLAVGRTDQPWLAVRVPRKPRPKPSPHQATEAAALRDAAILHGGRAGLAVLLLLYTGARAGEVAAMRWDEIDLRRGVICWDRSKNLDEHELPLAAPLAAALKAARPLRATGHMFAGNNGRPHVRPQTVWQWVKQVAEIAGVDTSPKRLRATLGNRILDLTGDLDAAATILGHASADTTRAYYTDTSPDRIRAAMSRIDY